jgi:hypothetical protein
VLAGFSAVALTGETGARAPAATVDATVVGVLCKTEETDRAAGAAGVGGVVTGTGDVDANGVVTVPVTGDPGPTGRPTPGVPGRTPIVETPVTGATVPVTGAIVPVIGATVPVRGAIVPVIGAMVAVIGATVAAIVWVIGATVCETV